MIRKKDNKKDNKYEARLMLSGVKKGAELAFLGSSEFTSGRYVDVKEPKSGLLGKYLITADRHVISGCGHQVRLQLEEMV